MGRFGREPVDCSPSMAEHSDRQTVMVCLVIITALIFMLFFAKNVTTLIVGEMLINIPIGFINNVAREFAR